MIAGVDPGKSGAIAFWDEELRDLRLFSMPLVDGRRGGDVDRYQLATLFELHRPELAVVEEVSAMVYVAQDGTTRGQGAAASFNFGRGYGSVLGVLAALGIPVLFAKPAVWKSALGLSSSKDASRVLAARIFPAFSRSFSRKKDDGFAEAALLAKFGQRLKIPT